MKSMKKKRILTEAGREKIRQAQKKRWARYKRLMRQFTDNPKKRTA